MVRVDHLPWHRAPLRGVGARAAVCADTPPPRRVYAAIGDSITHGWCGNVTYPTELARWNGWEPRNLGIQGLALMGAGYGREMGSAILKSGADFATVMIGINDCGKTDPSVFRLGVAALIDTVRAAKPELPLAIITPTYASYCTRHLRDATVDEVEPRLATDHHLVLIKGQALLAAAFLLPAGNPHPSVAGSNELAANLNAELGFGRLGFDVLGCAGGVFSLRLKGLTASGEFAVFGGPATERDGGERMGSAIKGEALKALGGRCKQRSLMLTPERQQLGRADDRGGAKVEAAAAGACDASAFQVVDLSTCVTSRVGSARRRRHRVHARAAPGAAVARAAARGGVRGGGAAVARGGPLLRCYAQRYPDLLGLLRRQRGEHDWPRLMDHWWASGQKEDRIYGCEQKNKKEGKAAPALSPPPPPPPALAKGEEAELRCYAQRYPDLLAGFCGGDAAGCDWLRLRDHWKLGGEAEGRTFGCEAKKPKKQTVEHAPKKQPRAHRRRRRQCRWWRRRRRSLSRLSGSRRRRRRPWRVPWRWRWRVMPPARGRRPRRWRSSVGRHTARSSSAAASSSPSSASSCSSAATSGGCGTTG